ncbi:MAG: TIGR03790 family protein [Planctomycetes bacterium]|nr:TIGR03790 family protein [Planctomycetota bacterium]
MRTLSLTLIFLLLVLANVSMALEPEEILVIANGDIKESVELANYYCAKRNIPKENILLLSLGPKLNSWIGRAGYEKKISSVVYNRLNSTEFIGKIKCLVTTYGIPFKVAGRGVIPGQEDTLKKLNNLLKITTDQLNRLKAQSVSRTNKSLENQKKQVELKLSKLKLRIEFIKGSRTGASVDSELSMVLFGKYELFHWTSNELRNRWPEMQYNTQMVCRLDGPTVEIAKGLIDKSLNAEKYGLNGTAYIDSGYSALRGGKPLFVEFDNSMRQLAEIIRVEIGMKVVEERTTALFQADQCKSTALYCGWYSLKNYIDAFDFVDGAIGYHIASFEAINLRDPNSTQWCPAMLRDGVTATIGAVAEPYLHAFPKPKEFFVELFRGYCLVEAYYHTNPFNSWQLMLIGDPLYKPFGMTTKKFVPANVDKNKQRENLLKRLLKSR